MKMDKKLTATLEPLTKEAHRTLQRKLDELDDEGLERALSFLEPEMGGGTEDTEITLNIDELRGDRQHALRDLVNQILGQAGTPSLAAPLAMTFPVVEPPASPFSQRAAA